MTILESLVHTHLANALGWTLFHSLWEGAVAALLLLTVLGLVQSPRLRYPCAAIALLIVLLSFLTTLARFLPEEAAAPAAIARAIRNVPVDRAAGPFAPSAPLIVSEALPWLAPFWIAGVVFFQARGVAGWVLSRRLRRRGVCCAPDAWQRRLTRLRESLRLCKPVVLLESCLTTVPVVVGHMRPVILIPIGMLTGMPAAQVEAILLHELAHVLRRDYLANLLQTVTESFLFYHPAVWWISGVMRAERENCCDDLVVGITGNAPDYANALASLEQNRWAAREAALAANGGNLMKRIRRLLDPPLNTRGTMSPVLSAGMLTLAAALAVTAWQATAPAPAAPTKELAAPWKKWKQEVAYIMQDSERAAFANLKTDEEREKFVEQFWLRRDPTPGTVENEFKEEHYRRIAYANEHFAGNIPGWKTDLGRIYIQYGPPDEIDAHPDGSPASALPWQQWRYRHIEGIGDNIVIEFVDSAGNGEYHMTTDPHQR